MVWSEVALTWCTDFQTVLRTISRHGGVDMEGLARCKEECTPKSQCPCSDTVFDLSCLLMQEKEWDAPKDAFSAVELYILLRTEILQNIWGWTILTAQGRLIGVGLIISETRICHTMKVWFPLSGICKNPCTIYSYNQCTVYSLLTAFKQNAWVYNPCILFKFHFRIFTWYMLNMQKILILVHL